MLRKTGSTSSPIKNILRNSAFLRYLHLDLKIGVQLQRFKERISKNKPYNNEATEVSFSNSENNIKLGKRAIDEFLEKLAEFTEGRPVLLVIDGDRDYIYFGNRDRNSKSVQNNWFQYLIDKAVIMRNIEVIDMHPIFQKEWEQNGKMFNYSYDGHWNELGHSIVAEAILSSSLFKKR